MSSKPETIQSQANKESVAVPSKGKASESSDLLLLPKAIYFFFFITIYTIQSYQVQLIESRLKISTKSFAAAKMLEIFGFFGSLFWTSFADKTGKFKTIMCVSTTAYVLFWGTCFLPNRYIVTESERRFVVGSIIALSSFFQASLFPLTDACVMAIISKKGAFSKELFGRQRLFGSIGQYIGINSAKRLFQISEMYFFIGFIISAMIYLSMIIFGIPNDFELSTKSSKKDDKKGNTSIDASATPVEKPRSPMVILLTNPSFLFFLLFMLIAGITRSFTTSYQNYYVDKIFGESNPYVQPISGLFRLASELLVYFFNPWMNKKFGPYWLLIFSQFAGAFRSIGYGLVGLVENIGEGHWWLCTLPFESFKGANSGLVTAGAIKISSELAPPGGASTAQGIYSGVFIGLSMFLGSLLAWLMIDPEKLKETMSFLFLSTGGVLIVFTIIFIAKYALVDKLILQGNKKLV